MRTEIEKYNPCIEAVEYRKQFNTFQEAWEQCPRGDWMLWLAEKIGVDLKTITLAKAHCANTVRHLMKDKRSTNAIDVAIRFGEGKATREELDAAAYAVDVAAHGAAAYTADVTATANAAANAAAYDAAYDADAAAAYTAAAYDADAAYTAAAYVTADAKKKNQLETANICKLILTEEVFKILEIKNT